MKNCGQFIEDIKKKIEMPCFHSFLCIINTIMSNTIIDGTQFNSENIQYSAPKLNASSAGKSIGILNKQTKSPLRISTPLLLTWGASDYEGNGKFNFSLQFPQEEYKTEDSKLFLNNLIAFENKIKVDALKNCKEWLGKPDNTKMETLEAMFSPLVKYPKNKETLEIEYNKAPTLNVKLPFYEGKWTNIEIFDEDRNKIFPSSNPAVSPLTLLLKGSTIACLLQCGGIWVASGKFGVTWKLIQAVIQKPKNALVEGQCYVNISPATQEKLKNAPSPQIQEEEDAYESSTLVQETDDEGEEEKSAPAFVSSSAPLPVPVVETSAPEPAPEPITVVKPNRIVRKPK